MKEIILAGLKKRKRQMGLIGVSLCGASILFVITLGLMKGLQNPFERMYEELNASHLLLFIDGKFDEVDEMVQWLKEQREVVEVTDPIPFYGMTESAYFKGQKIETLFQLTERLVSSQNQIIIRHGDSKPQPELGEIWIPQHLADRYRIQIGDTIKIPIRDGVYSLKVSASIMDPHYSSGLINPTRIWISPGELALMFPISKLSSRMIGIRLLNPEQFDGLWIRFNEEYLFRGMSLNYSFFRQTYLTFYQLIGTILMIFSVIGVGIASFLISSSISQAVQYERTQIGILRTLGYSIVQIRGIYLFQIGLLALAFVPLGLGIGYICLRLILKQVTASMGVAYLGQDFLALAVISLGCICLLIGLLTWWRTGQVHSVSIVNAIRKTATNRWQNIRISNPIFSSLSIPSFLAVKSIVGKPMSSMLSVIGLTAIVFILSFSVNIIHSFTLIPQNAAQWGLDQSDLKIRREGKRVSIKHEQLMDLLTADSSIRYILPNSYYTATVPAIDGKAPQTLIGKIYEGNFEDFGYLNINGRHPSIKDEVSLAKLTSLEYQKEVGDSLTLFLEGQKATFLITGIYQDIGNLGRGFRLHSSAIHFLNPLFKPNGYSILLKKGVEVEAYKQQLQKRLAETISIEPSTREQLELTGVMKQMKMSLLLIVAVFLTILFISQYHEMVVFVRKNWREIGILKSLGLTSLEIRKSIVLGRCILICSALLLGLGLSIWGSPLLMSMLMQGVGIVHFPFELYIQGLLLVMPIILVMGIVGGWMASKSLINIRVIDLLR